MTRILNRLSGPLTLSGKKGYDHTEIIPDAASQAFGSGKHSSCQTHEYGNVGGITVDVTDRGYKNDKLILFHMGAEM